MDGIIIFFKETLSGIWLVLYVIVCLIMILAGIGKIGDRKRLEMREQMKAKKQYDLLSGRAAAQASLEGKQVISYSFSEEKPKDDPLVQDSKETPGVLEINNSVVNIDEKKDDVPDVLVLGDSEKK